jgi:histidinol-phosphate aminotransferase
MRITRRLFVHTLGVGAGAASLNWVSARGAEALQAEPAARQQASAPARDLVRLHSNENPVGPCPAALRAIERALGDASRYPQGAAALVSEAVGEALGTRREQVLVGCGSGELLRMAVQAFTTPSRGLVSAAPTFELPSRTATLIGHPLVEVPLDRELRLDLDRMVRAARGAGLVFVCNPNNPTGTIHPSASVHEFVRRVRRESPDTVVMLDEAYCDYVADDAYAFAVPLALEEPNVVVVRTFSKAHGLAGVRVGYAVGQPATLQRMAPWRLDNNVNVLGGPAAAAAMRDSDALARERARNARVRTMTRQRFERLGFTVAESHANFVLVDIRRHAGAFREACLEHRIAVGRPFPPLTTWSRVSLGTDDEMARAFEVFEQVLARPGSGPA